MNATLLRARGRWVGAFVTSGALTAACIGFEVDYDGFCAQRPEHPECAGAGASGQGGVGGGTGGTAGGGSGGAPMMGTGGGGTAGAGACADDAACAADQGEGSLCVGGACTKAAGACDATLLVVVAPGRAVDDAVLAEGCHFRDLDGARAAVGATTTRLAVYADEAVSTEALAFATAATLEGHHSDAAKAVALTLPPAAGTPLVRFGQGGALKGVELNGGGVTTAVRAEGGTLAVSGPTALTNASPALELAGKAAAAVTGTGAAPVHFAGNQRGIVVPTDATIIMRGDDDAESLVVEGTSGGGAAVFFEAATTAGGCSTLSKVTLRENVGSSGVNGTGGIEVRKGRQLVIDGCTFVHNQQSVTFGGGGDSKANDFLGVHLENNDFADALPTQPANTGSVLCGDNLGSSDTTLNLRVGNVFPGAPGTCEALPGQSQFNCGIGQVFAHSAPNLDVNLACTGGTFQCGGGT
jgi:hypothetical protein